MATIMGKTVIKQVCRVWGEAMDRRHGTRSLLLFLFPGKVPTLTACRWADAVWGLVLLLPTVYTQSVSKCDHSIRRFPDVGTRLHLPGPDLGFGWTWWVELRPHWLIPSGSTRSCCGVRTIKGKVNTRSQMKTFMWMHGTIHFTN